MIRAVIDTNVLISSLLSPSGNEALVVLAIVQGLLTPCFSDEILREYEGVLSRAKFSFSQDEIDAMMALLHERGELVIAGPLLTGLPDPEDEKFVACAHAASADFIVTGNRRHFPSAKCGMAVVNAIELLERMTLDLL